MNVHTQSHWKYASHRKSRYWFQEEGLFLFYFKVYFNVSALIIHYNRMCKNEYFIRELCIYLYSKMWYLHIIGNSCQVRFSGIILLFLWPVRQQGLMWKSWLCNSCSSEGSSSAGVPCKDRPDAPQRFCRCLPGEWWLPGLCRWQRWDSWCHHRVQTGKKNHWW